MLKKLWNKEKAYLNRDLIGKVIIIFIFTGPILVPVLWLSGFPLFTAIADFGWEFGKAICSHTINSFTIAGLPMMICARCFGVASGLLLTGLIYHYSGLIRPRLPKNRLYLATIIALLFIPWLIDSGLQRLGLWETDLWLMFPTGFLGGAALVLAPLIFWPQAKDFEDEETAEELSENYANLIIPVEEPAYAQI
jgi:uncharacterized membrane protein